MWERYMSELSEALRSRRNSQHGSLTLFNPTNTRKIFTMAVVLSPHSSNFLFETGRAPPTRSSSFIDVSRSNSESSSPRIDLSEVDLHQWPESYNAAVSKLLDDAGIPNVLWGDLLYRWRGSPHIAQVCYRWRYDRNVSMLTNLWRTDVWFYCRL